MKRAWIALALGVALLVVSASFVLSGARIAAFLVDPSAPPPMSAPPTLSLASPADGEGVAGTVRIAGEARAAAGSVVTDLQLRVDGGRWASLPDAPRGLAVAAFASDVSLSPGDHVIEARAWDGAAYGMPQRALVRAAATAPPTVTIALPQDGAGVASGALTVVGTARGATRIVLDVDGETHDAVLSADAWSVSVALAPGFHVLRAQAMAPTPSLPARAVVAAAPGGAPTLTVASPARGEGFGSAGSTDCASACILFHGTVTPGANVAAALDGGASSPVEVVAGAWSWRVPMDALMSGPHRAVLTPDGGVPREIPFEVRTPRAVSVSGDDAPRLTQTALAFSASGLDPSSARWTLDGAPAGAGATISVALAKPGPHTLGLQGNDARGRSATATLPLLALDRAPTATFRASGGPAVVDTPFVASAHDADGSVVRYDWEFGDGAVASTTGPNTTHRYLAQGLYRANLTVLDDQGASSPTASLLVGIANAPPVADFALSIDAPSMLDAVGLTDLSSDADGAIASRSWDFGDGARSTDPSPTHTFLSRGDHVVSLRVTDDLGAATVAARLVHVRDIAPDARFTWSPYSPKAGEDVVFADGSRKPDGAIATRAWDFHEGDNATGLVARHAFATPGQHQVTLRVVDDMGVASDVTHVIDVGDAAPQVRDLVASPARPDALAEVSFHALANDVLGDIVAYAWDFGDGHTSNASEPTHAYARSGDYTVRVVVTNRAGESANATRLFTVVDLAPTPRLDVTGNFAGYPVVLAADASTDPDGAVTRYRFDADGDGLPECDGAAPRCTFVYPGPGIYAANLTIADDEGATASLTQAVHVDVAPPALAPPTLALAQPSARAVLAGTLVVSGTAQGPRAIVAVELQLRNGTRALAAGPDPWMRAAGNASWHALLDTTAFPDGTYSLVVRARDSGAAEGYLFTPVSIRNGDVATGVQLRIANAPTEPIASEYELDGSAYHPQGVSAVRYRLDEGPWRDAVGPAYAFSVPLRGLAPGAHGLTVAAFHGIDEKREAQVVLQVAQPAPALAIDEPPGPLAYGLIHAAGRIEGNGTAQWRLDTGLWEDIPRVGGEWRLDHLTGEMPTSQHTVSLRSAGPDGALGDARVFQVKVVRPAFPLTTPSPDAPAPTIHEAPAPWCLVLVALGLATFGAARRRL